MTSTAAPDWLAAAPRQPDPAYADSARQRQTQLTKPPGALGRLEDIAIQLAALQGRPRPAADQVHIAVFAADHGVIAEGISPFPQSVTAAMIHNFAQGGAAISVLARTLGATLEVIDLGTASGLQDVPGVRHLALGPGSANFTTGPAMTPAQCAAALAAGRDSLLRAQAAGCELYIGGEMGIGNTTAATALACALLDEAPARLAGPGAGLDAHGVSHKAQVVTRALAHHRAALADLWQTPWQTLCCLGGFEIAALAGSYIAAAQHGVPLLIDGYIATTALLAAERLSPGLLPWCLFGHGSAEPGHAHVLQALAARPLLDLGMRLGEASGAATAVPLLRLACALHNDMATFAEAGIAGGPA
jgi:nicotinate-nucleotide--dimethylbenzimidazole phosphoribosyltransferase